MSKIHITLVGGQPAPVYNGIVATKPDKVVYVYSQDSLKALKVLKVEIDIPSDDYPPLDPTNPVLIKQRAELLADKYKNDDITLNISSGLKSWSHIFGIVFDKQPNADVVYMDQNNILWNYRTMQGSSDFVFDMHTLFRLYGNSLENNYINFSDYSDEDISAAEKIEKIREFNYKDFNVLTTDLKGENKNTYAYKKFGKFTTSTNSYVEWEKTDGDIMGFVRICLYNKRGKCAEIKVESPHAVPMCFNSGWFEYKVAKLISSWDKSKEICLNCKFPFKKGIDKHETDIIVNTGTKMLFVECKTQISHISDIDKFRSVVKGYGGTGSKGLFVTDAVMTEVAKQICEENGILSFSLQDNHLGMSNEQALQMLLNSELFNINTK